MLSKISIISLLYVAFQDRNYLTTLCYFPRSQLSYYFMLLSKIAIISLLYVAFQDRNYLTTLCCFPRSQLSHYFMLLYKIAIISLLYVAFQDHKYITTLCCSRNRSLKSLKQDSVCLSCIILSPCRDRMKMQKLTSYDHRKLIVGQM